MKRIKRQILTNFPARSLFFLLTFIFILITRAPAQVMAPRPTPSPSTVEITKCWAYSTGETAHEASASDGSRVFLGGPGAKVEALSLDGKKMWASELGGEINSNLLATESGLFLVTSSIVSDSGKAGGNVLRSLSKETGITNWTLKMPESHSHFLGIATGLVMVVSTSGVVQAIDGKSGAVKWKRELAEGFTSPPAFTNERVYVASTDKQIFGISIPSGEISLVRKLPYRATAIGWIGENDLAFGDERGNLTSIAVSSGKRNWKFKSGGEITGIVAVNDHLLATSHDNFVYWLKQRNGGVAWKKRFPGRVTQTVNVLDRFALISSFEDHGAVLADLVNGKIVGQIVVNENETLAGTPIVSDGLILILTNRSAFGFRLNGCLPKSEGGTHQ